MLHLDALDVTGPVDRGVEGRHLVDRTDQELVALLETAHPFEQRAVTSHHVGQRRAAYARPCLDFLDGLGLQSIAVLADERAVRRPRSPSADREKDVVCLP